MSNVLTAHGQQSSSEGRCEDIQAEATTDEVGPYVDKKYTASSAPVRRVVVIGKWTVAGCVGWLIVMLLYSIDMLNVCWTTTR